MGLTSDAPQGPILRRRRRLGGGEGSPPQPTRGSGERNSGRKWVLVYFELEKTHVMITNLCLLTFACLEIPWHIGRIMVPDPDLVFLGGGVQPHQPPLVYATECLSSFLF